MTDDDGTDLRAARRHTRCPTPPDELVPLEVPAGTLVVLHGLLPHWSDANRSGRSRHAYTRALHLRHRRLPRLELAAAPGGHAAAPARYGGGMMNDLIQRAPKVLLHDHLDGGLRPGDGGRARRRVRLRRVCRPPTSTSCSTWFNRGAKRNDLVLYLETFAHTVGVMQHRDAIERVAVRVRPGSRRRRRRVRRGPLRARAAHRGRAHAPGGARRGARRASSVARPAPTSRSTRSARRCAPPRTAARSPNWPSPTATAASSGSTSPAPRPATRRHATSTRSST